MTEIKSTDDKGKGWVGGLKFSPGPIWAENYDNPDTHTETVTRIDITPRITNPRECGLWVQPQTLTVDPRGVRVPGKRFDRIGVLALIAGLQKALEIMPAEEIARA